MKRTGRSFPNLLRVFRRLKGLSQEDIKKMFGLTCRSTVSYWERGICMPGGAQLFKLAKLYGVHPHELYPEYLKKMGPELSDLLVNHVQSKRKKKRKTKNL